MQFRILSKASKKRYLLTGTATVNGVSMAVGVTGSPAPTYKHPQYSYVTIGHRQYWVQGNIIGQTVVATGLPAA